MSSIVVRPFRRTDREQLTALVNNHIAAVVPGISVSVHSVLSQLEREPDEFIVDPWVSERMTLVAEQHQRLVAVAHLLRYADEERVGPAYRDSAEIRWLVCWAPESPWADADTAGDRLAAACLEQFDRWGVNRCGASGDLPAPAVYGVPEQWPHVRAIYERAGFAHTGHTEVILLARVESLPRKPAPQPDLTARRSVGINGTRFTAYEGDRAIGYLEVENRVDHERQPRHTGWADVGNLTVDEAYRRRGVASWLFGQAADWLELGNIGRLLAYAAPEQEIELDFYRSLGLTELTRTARGWFRQAST